MPASRGLRELEGSGLPFVARSKAEGVAVMHENVTRIATASAEETSHCDMLHGAWQVDRVNHSEVYSDHRKHTNMVESYFARLRRMVLSHNHQLTRNT